MACVCGLVLIIVAVVFGWTAWERKKTSKIPKPIQPEIPAHKRKKSRVANAVTDVTSQETHYTETEPLLEPPKREKHARKKEKEKEKENKKNGRRHHHRK